MHQRQNGYLLRKVDSLANDFTGSPSKFREHSVQSLKKVSVLQHLERLRAKQATSFTFKPNFASPKKPCKCSFGSKIQIRKNALQILLFWRENSNTLSRRTKNLLGHPVRSLAT